MSQENPAELPSELEEYKVFHERFHDEDPVQHLDALLNIGNNLASHDLVFREKLGEALIGLPVSGDAELQRAWRYARALSSYGMEKGMTGLEMSHENSTEAPLESEE